MCGVALSGGKDQCWIGNQVNVSNGIKEPTHAYPRCNANQVSTIDMYLQVGESLYTEIVTCVHTLLNHIDAKAILAYVL